MSRATAHVLKDPLGNQANIFGSLRLKMKINTNGFAVSYFGLYYRNKTKKQKFQLFLSRNVLSYIREIKDIAFARLEVIYKR